MFKFFFLLAFMGFSQFVSAEDVMLCGPKPGVISSLLSDAEKIRQRCLDQVYEENRAKAIREVHALQEVQVKLDEEIKQTAISSTISTVQCVPNRNQTRDPKLVRRCQDAVRARTGVIARIDKLMGWQRNYPRPDARATSSNSQSKERTEFPCPSHAELQEMQTARVFNKRINEMWMRCSIDG